jgi:hypothetical protein
MEGKFGQLEKLLGIVIHMDSNPARQCRNQQEENLEI